MYERSGPAAKNGFQAGQTAKARQGPLCAVTPDWDMAAGRSTDAIIGTNSSARYQGKGLGAWDKPCKREMSVMYH